ncbi:MAG: hypothetical protein COA88_01655 [Kordia sp.]|nr:MAG: hypothetical protein COA88_01655 [Kordia sp.]
MGRITSIAVQKTNINHIIVGAEHGGVWRTTNKGTTWTPLADNHSNLVVTSLAMDPTNPQVFYWGSGDGKMYKSTDTGATWNSLPNPSVNGNVIKIIIHPTNANLVFAAVEDGMVYRSTDGGSTWTGVTGESTGHDIEFKPGDPNTVYATGGGFYKSTDGGANFTAISGFTDDAKMIAVSAQNPAIVYVLEANAYKFGAFYKSTNSGATFTKLSHSKNYLGGSTLGDDDKGQAPGHMAIAASPTNANEVHIAGINTWKSSDAGVTFIPTSDWMQSEAIEKNIGYCHADVEIFEFINNTLFTGTDGGIYIAENTATINKYYYTQIGSGLGIRHLYRIGVSQTNPVVVSGGSQDNGSALRNAAGQWSGIFGGDGMETFIDKNNPNKVYCSIYYGQFYQIDDQGLLEIASPDDKQGQWVTPIEQDPTLVNTIYTGYDQVYKSTDEGYSWTAISQVFGLANLDHLKIAASNNKVMYASSTNKLYKTTTGSGTWIELTGFNGDINSIAIHPTDPNRIAIATNGVEKVYVSLNGGTTWTSYKKNLPNFDAFALVWQNNANKGLYLGMNYGVYYIDTSLSNWETFNNQLPNVIINELEINTADSKLYAATYGRGVWRTPVYNSSLSVEEELFNSTLKIYPNPTSSVINISGSDGFGEIRLFSINGKLIYYNKEANLSSTQIDVSSLSTGVYFVKINSSKGVTTKKVMIN